MTSESGVPNIKEFEAKLEFRYRAEVEFWRLKCQELEKKEPVSSDARASANLRLRSEAERKVILYLHFIYYPNYKICYGICLKAAQKNN